MIFLDHARLAREVRALGHTIPEAALVTAEGHAKRLSESGGLVDVPFVGRERPGAASWGRTIATTLAHAGLPESELSRVVGALWESHLGLNLWSAVPDGLVEALAAFRSAGGKVAIVSNSEGMLDALFTRLGLRASFDVVADSGVLGVEKPDPRIFEHVLRACDTPPERALHLGDIFATDVLGARAAGIRHALIDPHGHYEGRHLEVPRVPDVARTCHAILAARA